MYFRQFLHDDTGCASYFIASRQSREAVVVDPQFDIQPYLDLSRERGYRICHVSRDRIGSKAANLRHPPARRPSVRQQRPGHGNRRPAVAALER